MESATPAIPLAYLITFRSFGTWLPGDNRGWIDRNQNRHDSPTHAPSPGLHRAISTALHQDPFLMDRKARRCVEQTLTEACAFRNWELHEKAVQTNHVHVVVSAPKKPEPVMTVLKSRCTRALREDGLIAHDVEPWARHGSTRYLWDRHSLFRACRYVAEMQNLPSYRPPHDF